MTVARVPWWLTRKAAKQRPGAEVAAHDSLGSTDSVTNAAGAVEVRTSFGAFGQRRNAAGWSGNPTAGDWTQITNTTRRGYTGHEMLDNLNLTHMNGRVYDQVVGRFLSADPFIDGIANTQGFNRYGYVGNNPLRHIDPSGFEAKDKVIKRPEDPMRVIPVRLRKRIGSRSSGRKEA